MSKNIVKIFLFILMVIGMFSCGARIEKKEHDENNEVNSKQEIEQSKKQKDDSKYLLEFKSILDAVNSEIKVGDMIHYGVMAYEINDYYSRDTVPMMEWEVLDIQDEKVLITTKQIILAEKFVDKDGNKANWENSDIRTVCSGTLGYIFSEYEEEGIIETEIVTNGKKTKDKVFILSLDEFLKYYGDNDKEGMNLKAISIASKKARGKGLEIRTNEDSEYYGAGSYWLRDDASVDGNAVWVGQYGHLYREGYDKNLINGIRLAMWVKKDHLTYEKRIKFGSFEQDANDGNGKESIVWYLLEKKNQKLCLLSKDILFNMQYDEENKEKEYNYSDSLIRKKLIEDFYENSFNADEKEVFKDIDYDTAINRMHHLEQYKNEGEKYSDKVIILSKNEYNRYVGHREEYYPPDSIRYESKMTKYAETSSESPYIEDELNLNYVQNTHKNYWLRDVGNDGYYNPTNEVKAFITSDRSFIVSSRVYMSYGVRPYIEIDLEKIKEVCENNKERIEGLQKEDLEKEVIVDDNIDSAKLVEDGIITFGKKDDKVLAYFYKLLLDKYNLLLDVSHYDIDENTATFLVNSNNRSNSYYNNFVGFLTFKYDLSDKGFPLNEELIDEYDLINVDNSRNAERKDFIISEKNYVMTLLKLLNPSYIESYERLALKKSIIDKYPKYRTKGILLDDENVEKNDKNDFKIFTIFVKPGNKNNSYDTGYRELENNEGLNEYEVDVVCYDKIVKYKLKVDLNYVDDSNFYIEDINYEYIKTINKPSGNDQPKYFLDKNYLPFAYDYQMRLKSIMIQKNKEEKIQKQVTTYKELVEKMKEEKRKDEELNYNGDLDEMDSTVQNWFYDYRDHQSNIINGGNGLKLSTMKFGQYMQSSDRDKKEDIEWYILSDDNGKKLLISKYILDSKKFSDNNFVASWEDSTLRQWLNNDFFNIAFNENEKKRILETEIKSTAKTMDYDILTKDKVFLLSYEDYIKYFKGVTNADVNPYGSTRATAYALSIKNGSRTLEIEGKQSYWQNEYAEGNSSYWLRDRRKGLYGDTYEYDEVVNVSAIGQTLSESFFDETHSGVRPVILISDSENTNIPKYEEKEKKKDDIENQQDIDGPAYKYLVSIGDKDIYIDGHTYIFTFEDGDKVRLGRLRDVYPPYSLNDIDIYTKDYYYFDKEKQLLYFKDYYEMYIDGPLKQYDSFCVIDKSLRKIKLDEYVDKINVITEEVAKKYETKLEELK